MREGNHSTSHSPPIDDGVLSTGGRFVRQMMSIVGEEVRVRGSVCAHEEVQFIYNLQLLCTSLGSFVVVRKEKEKGWESGGFLTWKVL